MKYLKLNSLLFCIVMFSGCVAPVYIPSPPAPPSVRSEVTRFNVISPTTVPQTVYFMPSQEQRGDIEFTIYKSTMAAKLQDQGFIVKDEIDNTDYVAKFIYGVGDRIDEKISMPIYDDVGGGLTYQDGTITDQYGNTTNVEIESFAPFRSEYAGTETFTISQFERYLNFVMYDNKNSTSDNIIQVYKAEVYSKGSNQSFNAVSGCLIDALFDNFTQNGFERIESDSCLPKDENTQ